MKRSKFSEEQIAYTSRQAEGSEVVAYVCLQPGISETTGTHRRLRTVRPFHAAACGLLGGAARARGRTRRRRNPGGLSGTNQSGRSCRTVI